MSATVESVTWRQARDQLSTVVRSAVPTDRKLDIVEAGCGRRWGLDVDPSLCHITGIDTDDVALRVRVERHNDLHEAVIGDVQNAGAVPPASTDLVYSSFVIEHLPRAEEAMAAWIGWLRPGGMIIAIVPDAHSVYGFVSRRTPHWLHVWAYRYILGRPEAGTPGNAPYPVRYSRLMSASGLREFAAEHGLEVVETYAIGDMYAESPQVSTSRRKAIATVKRVASVLSFGRLYWRHDNLAIVLRRAD